mgnify:CR=1 FL=1
MQSHQFEPQVAGVERPATAAPAPAPGAAPAAAAAERPAWLPAKFKTAEEMAIAYGHLETKLGAPKEEAPVTPPAKAEGEAKPDGTKPEDKPGEKKPDEKVADDLKSKGIDIDGMSQRFWDTGDLAADDRTALTTELTKVFGDKAGELIDSYVAGKKAELDSYNTKVFTPLGGDKTKAEPILAWARTPGNLDDATRATINALWSSEDVSNHVLASQKLADAYKAKVGEQPALTLNGQSVPAVTSDIYLSDAQMAADQRDKRYKTDPAFRAAVEAKVKRTLSAK